MSTAAKGVLPLVIWTVFVWGSRVRNVVADDELSSAGRAGRLAIAALFVILAVVVAQRLWVARGAALSSGDRRFVWVFGSFTVAYWAVRGVGIIADDHTVAFTVVHTVLMVVSMLLGALAVHAVSRQPSISSSELVAR